MKLKREFKRGWFWDVDLTDGSVVSSPCDDDQVLSEEFLSNELGVSSFRDVERVARIKAVGCRHMIMATNKKDNYVLNSCWNTFGDIEEARKALMDDEETLRQHGSNVEVVEETTDSPGLAYLRRKVKIAETQMARKLPHFSENVLYLKKVEVGTACHTCGVQLSVGDNMFKDAYCDDILVCGDCHDIFIEDTHHPNSLLRVYEDLRDLECEFREKLAEMMKQLIREHDVTNDELTSDYVWALSADDALVAERVIKNSILPDSTIVGVKVESIDANVTELRKKEKR